MGRLAEMDLAFVQLIEHLRFVPVDEAMAVASAWWVKSLLILAIALGADLVGRSRWPRALIVGAIAYAMAEVVSIGLKATVDRARPSIIDPSLTPLVALPDSAAMPSGHAATAFAAAVAVSMIHPRLRWPLVLLAALIAVSRVWLGVHFPSDVIVGAAIGALIAVGVVRLVAVATQVPRFARPRTVGE
jgi:membrane-associated phospholipid phosphatase